MSKENCGLVREESYGESTSMRQRRTGAVTLAAAERKLLMVALRSMTCTSSMASGSITSSSWHALDGEVVVPFEPSASSSGLLKRAISVFGIPSLTLYVGSTPSKE